MNALELGTLTKRYGRGVKALDRLSLNVPQGVIFGFLGLNGAGKTTTINILAGFLKKDRGTIRLFGKEIQEGEYEYKRELGFVLDRALYFEQMTGREYLEFVGEMYDVPRQAAIGRVDELLEFLDLQEKADDLIGTYSTGMKKKTSLAAAIIHKPRLVVLDEPLEGIDALSSSEIKELLKLMAKRGTTVFMTSHVLDTVEKICDEMAIIDRGRLVLQCEREKVRGMVKQFIQGEHVSNLEQLFVGLVGRKTKKDTLSWLRE
jgi:ABC-2 type transport system ATP-binding protein